MSEKLGRAIAVLEVEAAMVESHSSKLLETAAASADSEQRQDMLKLSHEEADEAEAIRRQIRLLRAQLERSAA
jgi:hypothetical protein